MYVTAYKGDGLVVGNGMSLDFPESDSVGCGTAVRIAERILGRKGLHLATEMVVR